MRLLGPALVFVLLVALTIAGTIRLPRGGAPTGARLEEAPLLSPWIIPKDVVPAP